MLFQIITIFPEFFDSPIKHGLVEKAIDKELFSVKTIDLRDFAKGRHRQVDDTPFGGGPGMVLMPAPLEKAIASARENDPGALVLALSPGGKKLDDETAGRLAQRKDGIVFVCGRYEGIDQRIIDHYCDGEISIGDYVLTGGEAAALVAIDAIGRKIPGVVQDPESVGRDSFSSGLAHPQYTKPREFKGRKAPDELLSGNHALIEKWRQAQAASRTASQRPDLLPEKMAKNLWLVLGPQFADAPEPVVDIASARQIAGVVFSSPTAQGRKKLLEKLEQKSDAPLTLLVKRSGKDAIAAIQKLTGEKCAPVAVDCKDDFKRTNEHLNLFESILKTNGAAALMVGFENLPKQNVKHLAQVHLSENEMMLSPFVCRAALALERFVNGGFTI